MAVEIGVPKRGDIFDEDAYEQGKMLVSSSWQLPRLITPSDVDMCFDSAGDLLVCELSKVHKTWETLRRGQQMLYKNFVRRGVGRIWAALCYHKVPKDRYIDTKSDIESFALMSYFEGDLYASRPWPHWGHFVEKEFFKIGGRNSLSEYRERKM